MSPSISTPIPFRDSKTKTMGNIWSCGAIFHVDDDNHDSACIVHCADGEVFDFWMQQLVKHRQYALSNNVTVTPSAYDEDLGLVETFPADEDEASSLYDALTEKDPALTGPTEDQTVIFERFGMFVTVGHGTYEGSHFYRIGNRAGMGGGFMSPSTLRAMAYALLDHAETLPFEDDEDIEDECGPECAVCAEADEVRETYPIPMSAKVRRTGYVGLTDQGRMILRHIRKAGSISAREAMADYGITSATLARRVCDLEEAGFTVVRTRKTHPMTGRLYTRYSVSE